jgi:4-hydroxy-tetrahydrodipicolinate synthase
MDTGYANYLEQEERNLILELTRETIAGRRDFIAGAFVEGLSGDLVGLYRSQMDQIVAVGGTPILIQTTRFHSWKPSEIIDLYANVCEGYESVIGFELGSMFAPNGMIFDEETIRSLMGIPALKGIKHSSLDRGVELRRLQIKDEIRPDFKIFTGNDLAIDMTEYGSDYLLGLAAFCPELFALRDKYWLEGDERYDALTDAIQYLGNVSFRAPVPAYKHSCAVFQHLIGRCPSPLTHPKSAKRPQWEAEIMADCASRLSYPIN